MERWRVDELAERAGVSVEVIRSYQSKRLLPPPRHEGRVAYYDGRHLERLRAIRDLKVRGHSLRAVAEMLGRPAPGAVVEDLPAAEALTLGEVAERTGVPPAMLRSLEASGILRPVRSGHEATYTGADVRAVRMLLDLVGSGVPMEEFMAVARVQLAAASEVADGAVELFMRYIRDPLASSHAPSRAQADQVVASFRLLSKAASGLIAYNFERTLLDAVQRALDERGTRSERAAMRREAARRNDVA